MTTTNATISTNVKNSVKNVKINYNHSTTNTSQKNSIYKQYACVPNDGKLLGGHPVCGDLSYPIYSWYENDTSSTGIFRTAPSSFNDSKLSSFQISSSSSLFDTLDILNKLAYWFLFPIANDEQQLIFCNEDSMVFHNSSVWTSILFPMVNRLLQRFKAHSDRTARTIMTSVDAHTSHYHPDEQSDPTQEDPICLSGVSSNASFSCAYDVMFSSISSIDSGELKNEIEINTISLFPVITYGEEQTSERAGSMEDTSGPPRSESCDSFEPLPSISSSPHRSSHYNIEGLQWSWIAVPKDPFRSERMDMSQTSLVVDDSSQLSLQEQNVTLPMDQCAICQETFEVGQQLQVLPCNHRFHVSCLDKCASTASNNDVLNGLCLHCKMNPVLDDDDSMETIESLNLNGEVPSWAFARLGGFLAKDDFK